MSTIPQATQLSLLSPSPLVASPRVGYGVSYPIVSFFSGAGFLDLGLRRAGHKILWSCEYDPQICDTHDYAMEHYYRAEGLPGDVPYIECRGDIQKTKPSKIQKEAIGGLSKGEEFGVVGGPPCPDFSIGGKNRGGTGDHGRLTSVFVSMVCELGPLFFILENVKGLVNTRKHREFLSGEIHRLEEAGYAVDYKILNALDFGVPQDRERVFMVGVRKEAIRDLYEYVPPKSERAWFPWPHDPVYSGAKQKYGWPDTSPFGETPPMPIGIPEELFVAPLIMDQETISKLPNGEEGFEPYSDKFKRISEGDDSRKSFKRLHRYRYSPTVAYGNNEVHLHPALPRRLRVREALRLQTVPDTYAFPPHIPLSKKFKIVGNGVPVKLATKVGEAVSSFLSGESPPSSL